MSIRDASLVLRLGSLVYFAGAGLALRSPARHRDATGGRGGRGGGGPLAFGSGGGIGGHRPAGQSRAGAIATYRAAAEHIARCRGKMRSVGAEPVGQLGHDFPALLVGPPIQAVPWARA